jgi:hypothetical protein
MTDFGQDRLPEDLVQIAQRLERERPAATPLELDRVRSRVRMRVRGGAIAKGTVLKTRLAILMMVVLGVLMSGTGAGLALSGSSESDSAAQSQYNVSPNQNQGGPVLGTEEASNPGDANAPEQVVATTSEDSLPFTGLAAVPILLLGLGLVTAGLVVARRTKGATQA